MIYNHIPFIFSYFYKIFNCFTLFFIIKLVSKDYQCVFFWEFEI